MYFSVVRWTLFFSVTSILGLFLFMNAKYVPDSSDLYFKAFPQVCNIQKGNSTCSTEMTWNAPKTIAGPVCLFVEEGKGGRLVGCGQEVRSTISWIGRRSYNFSLRQGSTDFLKSKELKTIQVLGVSDSSTLDSMSLIDAQVKKRMTYKSNSGLAGSSWDGRLWFGVSGITTGKLALTVRSMRPSILEGVSSDKINFEDPKLFSKFHIIETDFINPNERQRALSQGAAPQLENKAVMGLNTTRAKLGFHFVVYPHGSVGANPYRSNANGGLDKNGKYMTYRMYGILPTIKAGAVESPYSLNGNSEARKSFLSRVEMQIIVKNFDTGLDDIESIKLLSEALPLRDTNGNLLHGYEPSVTLDGRLIVYSANFKPDQNAGHGGTVGYSYISNSHRVSGWSVPENLGRMFYKHGPGASREVVLNNGQKFSEAFPISKYRIREFDGAAFTADDIIQGAYPWVSFKGTEVIFSVKSGFHGAGRHGTHVVGERTKWVMRRIDGDMDPTRGNVTDRFSLFVNTELGIELKTKYEETIDPHTNRPFGKDGFWSVLTISLGEFPSSWNGVSRLDKSPLPLNPFKESFGFFMSGNRYSEVHFPDFREDLLVFMPMNEPLKMNKVLNNNALSGRTIENPETLRSSSYLYQVSKTADYSGNFQTGYLSGTAKYPFEYYNAKNQWLQNKKIFDRNEGAYGNSISLGLNGKVSSQLLDATYKKINTSQAFTLSFWFKKSADLDTPIFIFDNLLKINLRQKNIYGELLTYKAGVRRENSFNVNNILNANNSWNHLTVSYRFGKLSIFVNGVSAMTKLIDGAILNQIPEKGEFSLLSKGQNIWVDEVYLYSIELPFDSTMALALKKVQKDTPQENALLVDLGRKLFNSKNLSNKKTISCLSCHSPSIGFADTRGVSRGWSGLVIPKQAPTLINISKSFRYFWDGRTSSLKSQVLHPIFDDQEMGVDSESALVNLVSKDFGSDFLKAFGRAVTLDDIAEVLARYVASLRLLPSEDKSPLTESQVRGESLFFGKANCVACHRTKTFSDFQFHDIGLETRSKNDYGLGVLMHSKTIWHGMKTPSLLNVRATAPYFHDGRADSLEDVVQFYNRGGDEVRDRVKSNLIKPLHLNQIEVGDLIDYLESLDFEHTQ